MDESAATNACHIFLSGKEVELGEPLALVSRPQRLSGAWAFFYQSRAFVETGAFSALLVGHGPVIIRDNGEVIEGGSSDHDPDALLARFPVRS
ncbi:MAG TPA: YrhB domain-containing protein [Sphingomonas sp.]|jgi:hypothetical protein